MKRTTEKPAEETIVVPGINITSKYDIGNELFYWDMRGKIPKVGSLVVNQINTITTKDNNGKVKQCVYYKGWGTEDWERVEEPFMEENLALSKEELFDKLK